MANTEQNISTQSLDIANATEKELATLTRSQLLTNIKKRNIVVEGAGKKKYISKAALIKGLINYFDTQEEDKLDETLYMSCDEEVIEDEEEDQSSSNLASTSNQRENQSQIPPNPFQFNQTPQQHAKFPYLPHYNPMMQFQPHHQFMFHQQPFMYQNWPQNVLNQTQSMPKKSNLTMPTMANSTVSFQEPAVQEQMTLEEKLFQVGRNSERQIIKRHPYLLNVGRLGNQLPKDIRELDDWSLVRLVMMWKVDFKTDVAHKDNLCYVLSRLHSIEREEWTKRSLIQPNGSLLVRTFHAIDNLYESGHVKVDLAEIDRFINDFERLQMKNGPVPRTGQWVRQPQGDKSGICFNYNGKGCKNERCRYRHLCQNCFNLGKQERHPQNKCPKF